MWEIVAEVIVEKIEGAATGEAARLVTFDEPAGRIPSRQQLINTANEQAEEFFRQIRESGRPLPYSYGSILRTRIISVTWVPNR
jgi:hypothetical protein